MTRTFRRSSVAVVALVFGLVAAGCGGGGSATLVDRKTTTSAGPTTTTVPAYMSFVAQARPAVTSVPVYDAPTASTPSRQLDNPWQVDPDYPDAKVPQVFLVKKQSGDWVQVLLPVRPNGSTGWVRAADVTVSPDPFRIKVSLGDHTITVTNATTVLYTGKVAVGASDTPTPTGQYYLRVLVQAIDPTTVYGPYAYGLSSHSDALETFAGGDAEIGIHGNNDASVLGKDVTHGCVRMDNDAITTLSKQLPLGTPVDITA